MPNPFEAHAVKVVKSTTSLYIPAEEVLMEPEDTETSLRIKDTL